MTTLRALCLAAALCAGAAPALVAQADLRAIWGSSPTDIWVVGEAPAALHWDGQAWNEMPFGVSRPGALTACGPVVPATYSRWGTAAPCCTSTADRGAG